MRVLRRPLLFLFAVATTLLACSGNDDAVDRSDTGTIGHGIVIDAGSDSPSPSDAPVAVDSAPPVCWIVQPTDPGVQSCVSCSQSACGSAWVAAYGSSFSSGDFHGGACESDARCACGCKSDDAVCIEACDISEPDACRSAKQAIHDCEAKSCAIACNRG